MPTTANPLLSESTLDYGAPDFNNIQPQHFLPAILKAMQLQENEILEITNNSALPSFENTILALEESDRVLDRVRSIFYAVAGANTNNTIKKIQKELAPKFSVHTDNIMLNSQLFQRIKEVYATIDTQSLDDESKHLTKEYYKNFVKAGADLPQEKKNRLKTINAQLAELSNTFGKKILDASKKEGLLVQDVSLLKGLSEERIAAIKGNNGYELPLVNTTQQPALQNLENRDIRKALYRKSIHRADQGNFNTSTLVEKMAVLRLEKAKILGFDNYASWSLQGTMAKTPTNVFKMFAGLVPGALQKAAAEIKEIQEEIKSDGNSFSLTPFDWNHYAEKVRKSKYNLGEEEVKQYFELTNVLEKGVFYAATKLYGITFKKRMDIPTYHPDVVVYELFEEDGSALGLFYGDFYARESKRGGAWMSSFVKQSKLRKQKPVLYNVCNFPKPATGAPALISFDNVETAFHEFGHALHGFFGNQNYESISGTSVARDFVEFPSQFNENWATHPDILSNYALHYKTGKVIPSELLEKIKKAGTFNQGYSIIENLASSSLDMLWHTIEKVLLLKMLLILKRRP
nr:M3 family metallopeptidase [Tenacibaculum sp. SG-28]